MIQVEDALRVWGRWSKGEKHFARYRCALNTDITATDYSDQLDRISQDVDQALQSLLDYDEAAGRCLVMRYKHDKTKREIASDLELHPSRVGEMVQRGLYYIDGRLSVFYYA